MIPEKCRKNQARQAAFFSTLLTENNTREREKYRLLRPILHQVERFAEPASLNTAVLSQEHALDCRTGYRYSDRFNRVERMTLPCHFRRTIVTHMRTRSTGAWFSAMRAIAPQVNPLDDRTGIEADRAYDMSDMSRRLQQIDVPDRHKIDSEIVAFTKLLDSVPTRNFSWLFEKQDDNYGDEWLDARLLKAIRRQPDKRRHCFLLYRKGSGNQRYASSLTSQ